jgi:para-nitrobenzyl esterase
MLQANWHIAAGNRAFEFQFDRVPPNIPKGLTNTHHSEVQYVFGLPAGNFTGKDRALSEAIQQYWTNFAKTGNPNKSGDLPEWPEFDQASKGYLELTEAGPVSGTDLRARFCKLWIQAVTSHQGPNSIGDLNRPQD